MVEARCGEVDDDDELTALDNELRKRKPALALLAHVALTGLAPRRSSS